MDDDRGNLALEYLKLAQRLGPRWLVWENVPGVLSSSDGRDFGAFIGGLEECGYQCAWRILDAQYFGVPQRRRRVFVVGYLGDWRPAAAVLFERESLFRNPPPSREAREDVAGTLAARSGAGGGLGTDFEISGGLRPVAHCLRSQAQLGHCAGVDTLVPTITLSSGQSNAEINEELAPTLNCNRDGAPIAFNARQDPDHSSIAGPVDTYSQSQAVAIHPHVVGRNENSGPQGKEYLLDGSAYTMDARGTSQAVAFAQNQRNEVRTMEVAGALAAEPGAKQQTYVAQQAYFIMPMNSGKDYKARETEVAQPIMAGGPVGGNQGGDYITQHMQVRRLTPIECERLQGFPDNFTRIPWGGKPAEECPDGHRYKALGNSMAVPVMHWIGRRIQMVEEILNEPEQAA